MSGVTLRVFRNGDEAIFREIVSRAFSGLEYLPSVRKLVSSAEFDPEGFFFAEEDGRVKGCVGVFNMHRPKWLEIAYLAVDDRSSRRRVAETLAERAVEYAVSGNPEFLMASTLAIQPYVDVYKGLGFRPVRRILRIGWELSTISPTHAGNSKVDIRQVSEAESDEAAHAFVEALHPYWDWWIEEKGGDADVLGYVRERMRGKTWLCGLEKGKIVGLARISPDYYAPKESGFWGVYVLPEFRERRIGSTLMREALNRARCAGQRKLVVFTVAGLDVFFPAVLLYLRHSGRIEAEYLHLTRS